MTPEQARPYFFLGHAHLAQDAHRDALKQLFNALCRHLDNTTTTKVPGFVDYRERTGSRWEPNIRLALANCRVFVPVYSPRFFESRWCGWEWEVFRRREREHFPKDDETSSAIVPVLWTARRRLTFPPCTKEVQYNDHRMGDSYLDQGFYGIKCDEPERLESLTYRIAESIQDAAEATKLPPGGPHIFADVPNPFAVPDV